MTEMVFGHAPPSPAEPVFTRWTRTVDLWTVATVFALVVIGLVLGLAASAPLAEKLNKVSYYFMLRQVVFALMALGGMVFLSLQSPATIRRWAVLGFFGAVIAILLLPMLGVDHGKGATRWYSVMGISLQPSEFLKPLFVVFTAWVMAASFERNGPPGRLISFLVAGFVAFALAMQPDFGQATLILAVWGVMYFVAGAPFLLLVGLGGAIGVAGSLAYRYSEHFARRIDLYLSADLDPHTQLAYAETAILQGGFLGVGVGEGSVKNTLPDAHTDFIIAVAAEEYGLLACLTIIGLFLLITLRALKRLIAERDPFARLAGCGLAALIALQAFVNLGVAIRLLPAKGMTLPFISYGGSSMLAAGMAVGFLLAMTAKRPQEDVADVMAASA